MIHRYRVKCLDPATGQLSTELVQGDPILLKERYARLGGVVLSLEPETSLSRWRRDSKIATVFAQELKVLLESGLNIVEAVEALSARPGDAALDRIYRQVLAALLSGQRLSASLKLWDHVFPDFFIASVQASERSGSLIPVLDRYLAYRERLDELRAKLVSAAIYPAIVLGASFLVVLFLVAYVIPKFSVVFADRIDRLPSVTRLLLQLGQSIANQPWQWLLAGLGTVALSTAVLALPMVRKRLAAALARQRWLRQSFRQYGLARLYRTLAMLLDAGIAFVPAMTMCRTLNGALLAAHFDTALREVESGQSIGHSFIACQLTDPVTQRILLAGERSGQVAAAFNHMARFIEQKLAYRIDRLARVLEPLIMLGVGSFIGLIVVLMYSPIFELAGALQ